MCLIGRLGFLTFLDEIIFGIVSMLCTGLSIYTPQTTDISITARLVGAKTCFLPFILTSESHCTFKLISHYALVWLCSIDSNLRYKIVILKAQLRNFS